MYPDRSLKWSLDQVQTLSLSLNLRNNNINRSRSQFVISNTALITIRWIHWNFILAVSQDGTLAGIIIVFTSIRALMLAALVALLVVEAFSEFDEDQEL